MSTHQRLLLSIFEHCLQILDLKVTIATAQDYNAGVTYGQKFAPYAV